MTVPRPLLALASAGVLALTAPPARAQPLDEPAGHAIVVGLDRDYPPYEFVDAAGHPAGFNVDLTRAIAEVMGMTVEFRSGTWAEMRAGLLSGEIDVLQGLTYSQERARELDFAPPHAIIQHAIFARRGTPPVASLDELRGKKVIVFGGGIMDETLTGRGFGADLVRTGTPADALRLLASGQHEYVALALLPGIHILRELHLTNVVPVARRVAVERYGYAVKKGHGELVARFDEGLAILKQTGRYDAIQERWLGVLEPRGPGLRTILEYVSLALVPLLLVLGGTVLWSRSLQKLVAQRTASLAREVAERKRSEEELRQHQQQLIQAGKMAALGVLVSGVAHEINNPNGYILLNMPILKAALLDACEVLDARRQELGARFELAGLPYDRMRAELPQMLDEMLAGGRRIKRIVDDLKNFARREDAPALEPMDVNAVAAAAVRLVDVSIRKATHRFTLELGRDLPRVLGNPQRIEQVLVNLLLNACQALPGPERAVRLATRHDPARGEVVVEVADEGAGIAPEDLPRLTDPFFTTKRETGGTGLGLSISATIVKEHGGALQFESAVGAGTTVSFALRAISTEAAA
ncbi:transporter substrate-binding domain-containing protein [Anaeromyxobacter diazotrophicus]|uniref:histidine kinase n=1 Tax=Anaeromyxobacter diazotrophicus TaxID=2590199 RepID=A0A7I9VK72_9BACT|nr:transporter substrate-binding domain-containing protein [Anaeromyxobacter diazotrophicus]GEJ56550.1 histidine kinase [Anaeromyxobacter diazotrophicus]